VTGAVRKQFESALVRKEDGLAKTAAAVWITDFLLKELPDKAAGIWLMAGGGLIQEPSEKLVGRLFDSRVDDPSPILSISSGRYVAITGLPFLFDLSEGCKLSGPKSDVFETRVFNLRILIRSCLERVKKWTSSQAGSGETRKVRPSAS